MAIFNDLGKKIQETSQGVVQKTKDTAEVIRLNGMISDEEKRMDNLFSQIGKTYFELHADASEPALTGFVAEIKDARKKIEQYAEQVKRLKGIVRCPICGGDVPYGATFCSSCGTKMALSTNAEKGNTMRCVKCGMPINADCTFCTHCGTKVEAPQVAPAQAVVVNDRCPNCDAPSNGMTFCVQCGTKING